MKQIFLIRHFKCANAEGLCYGQTDLLPNADFEDNLASLRVKLSGFDVDAVVSSPLIRCRLIAEELDSSTAVTIEPCLMEVDFGSWENKPWDKIPRAELDLWGASFVDCAPHGGETFRQLDARTFAAFQDILLLPHERIAIVTHAGPIRAILAGLLEMPLQRAFALNPQYGSVTRISYVDGDNYTIDFIC